MRTTQKAIDKRKRERAGLPAFFQFHVSQVTHCENCGMEISSPGAKNVAHILPKSSFKSVMTEPQNVMYLCSDLDLQEGKGCHDLYDSSWEVAKTMKIWSTAVERFNNFKDKVKEKSIVLLNFM